jgi:hypothetical protein
MMMTCQALGDVLDETIQALAVLDLERLQILEEKITGLAESKFIADESGINAVLAKKRVLELVLHDSASNLNALSRLYGRNTRDPWER